MTWRSLTVEQFNNLKNKVVIDVRSPCEHEKENIPGAINVPLLSDEERVIVGTIYAQQGEAVARRHAVGIISPKIPELVDRIIEMKKSGHALIVHCWRGGLRSEAVVSFLSVVGVDSFRLTGGYKAWRQSVVSDFEADKYAFKTIVLSGLTGAGKTDVLKELEKLGEQVVDLENLANHRGSVFGGVGLSEQPSQKNFEGRLWQLLKEVEKEFLFLEAESRKIGKVAVPSFMLERIKTSPRVLIESSVEGRCTRIMKEYVENMDKEKTLQVIQSSPHLKERLGRQRVLDLIQLFNDEKYRELIEILLIEYYDPLYGRHTSAENADLVVNGDNPETAAREITSWCQSSMRLNPV